MELKRINRSTPEQLEAGRSVYESLASNLPEGHSLESPLYLAEGLWVFPDGRIEEL